MRTLKLTDQQHEHIISLLESRVLLLEALPGKTSAKEITQIDVLLEILDEAKHS